MSWSRNTALLLTITMNEYVQEVLPFLICYLPLAAIKGDKILAELVECVEVHPNQVFEWKQLLRESAT